MLVVRLPIKLRPTLAIQRNLNNPRLHKVTHGCGVSRADAQFAEISAHPLAWLVLGHEILGT
jgi:D-arabinose 1-dehydrogenase-like Zn-dependent alcohol dehydrogenase